LPYLLILLLWEFTFDAISCG